MRIHFLSGYSVQSHRGKVWHLCAFGSWWESLLLDFHSWKKKIISWCPQISWHDVQEEGSEDELLAGSGPGLESASRSSSSPGEFPEGCPRRVPAGRPPRDTGLQSPGWGRAPLALHQPPPLLTTPYTYGLEAAELMDASSLGNKEKQRIRPRGGPGPSSLSSASWAVIGCGENLWKMPKSCPSEQNSPLFFLNSFFFFFLFCNCHVFPNDFIRSQVWCLLFLNLPKNGMFSPGKRLLISLKNGQDFFFFFGSNSALQKGLQTERRKCRRTNFLLCLTQNILLKLRAAPSTKVNICAKGTTPDAILRHPQFTLFPFDSLKHKSFTLWNLASRGKEVNIRKYTLEKVQDFFADNLLLIS